MPLNRDAPPWSWSVSRRLCFRECPRRYYWQYYGYWGGWDPAAPPLAQRAYRLRTLRSLPLLAGEVLHDVFSETLRDLRGGRTAPIAEALILEARRRMNVAWAQSKNRKAWEARPKDGVMLHEIYYGPEPSDARIDAVRRRLEAAVRGFLASASLREAASAPFQEIKGIDHEGHFDLEGTRVYAAPDLAYRRSDGSWRIVDWKTGAEGEEHEVQMGIYGLYLRARHRAEGPIAARLEYVSEGRAHEVEIDAAALDAAEREVRDSIAAMRGYLDDVGANRPREAAAFPLREDRRACPHCNFWEICRPEIEGAAQSGPF